MKKYILTRKSPEDPCALPKSGDQTAFVIAHEGENIIAVTKPRKVMPVFFSTKLLDTRMMDDLRSIWAQEVGPGDPDMVLVEGGDEAGLMLLELLDTEGLAEVESYSFE